jgi:hypothetical protein
MSDDIDRYRNMLHDSNAEARRRRKEVRSAEARIQELERQISELTNQLQESNSKIEEYETALVELDDIRLDLEGQISSVPEELEMYRQRDFLDQHKEAFEQMLGDTGLHPQASLDQLWHMVGYDPFQIEELTPDLVNEVIEAARENAPFLFMGKDVSQTMPSKQYQTGPQSAVSAANSGFVQPQGFLNSSQPAPRQAQAQAPNGWSNVAARGVPLTPPPQAIQGRFQDPKWIAENQKAIAEAVEKGAQFIDPN